MRDVRNYKGCERLRGMREIMRDVRDYEGCEKL